MLAASRRFRCSLLAVLLLVVLHRSPAEPIGPPGQVLIDASGNGSLPLSNSWKFRTGDNDSWKLPSLNDADWEWVSGDSPWGMQGHAGYAGIAWYRIRLRTAATQNAEVAYEILFPRVRDAYEVFWNGELVGRNGSLPPHPVWYASQGPQVFRLGFVSDGLLAIRVWKAPLMSDDSGQNGGLTETPLVGSHEAIMAARAAISYEWLLRRQFLFGEHLVYSLIGFLSLLLWLRNRRQMLLLWMMVFAIAPALVILLLDSHLRLPYAIAMGISQPISSVFDISLWFLLLWLLKLNENPSVLRIVRLLSIISFTVNCLDGLCLATSWRPNWTASAQSVDAATTGINTLIEMLPLLLVGFAVFHWRRLQLASWLVASAAFLDEMLVVIRDALKQGQRFTGWTIGEKIDGPLFTVAGNAISVVIISRALLLVVIVYAVYTSYREEQRRQSVMAQEFDSARELQKILIPETRHTIPGFALSSAYRPALQVGGDFFQLIPLDTEGDSTLLILGDVSGHGLKAALSVSYIVGMIRVMAKLISQPDRFLTEMNRHLCGRLQEGFATCLALRMNRFGFCELASAGHPPPFLNREFVELPGALPLGIDSSSRYQQSALDLKPGDHLVLYTDGLPEARSKAGKLYGFDRLRSLVAGNPTAEEAAEAAVKFGQEDDITVITVACVGGRETCAGEVAIAGARHLA